MDLEITRNYIKYYLKELYKLTDIEANTYIEESDVINIFIESKLAGHYDYKYWAKFVYKKIKGDE